MPKPSALDFKADDFVKVVGISGDYRYGYVQQVGEGKQHLTICMHDEGESKLSYEEAAMRWVGMAPPNWARELSLTEKSILEWISQGLSGNQMAERLGLSPNTVRVHIRNLRLKLQAEDRIQLKVLAQALAQHLNGSTATPAPGVGSVPCASVPSMGCASPVQEVLTRRLSASRR